MSTYDLPLREDFVRYQRTVNAALASLPQASSAVVDYIAIRSQTAPYSTVYLKVTGTGTDEDPYTLDLSTFP